MQLFDAQGRVLEATTANDEVVNFDLSKKSSGVYFVKIDTAKGVKVEKVIQGVKRKKSQETRNNK